MKSDAGALREGRRVPPRGESRSQLVPLRSYYKKKKTNTTKQEYLSAFLFLYVFFLYYMKAVFFRLKT